MKRLAVICAFLLAASGLQARERQDILKKAFTPEVAQSFVPGGDWFPYPAYDDREGWDRLLDKRDRERIIKLAEDALSYKWQIIPATAYLGFERTGDRQGMESVYYANRKAIQALIVGELLEGKGRFIDQMINGLWHSAQMTSWIGSAHQDRQRTHRALPDSREIFIDLASASYGAVMAVAWHFFHGTFDSIDPSISYSIRESVRRNILAPYMDDAELEANRWLSLAKNNPDGFVNNWNPWCNSNVVLAYLLVEDDPARLRAALYRSACSVDEFLEYTSDDGACEEGPSYWPNAAGRLYDYLQIMCDASGGKFNFLDNRRVRESGEFITRASAGGGYMVNFCDAAARQTPDINLVWNYGHAVGSADMTDFACSLMGNAKYSKFYAPAIPRDEIYRTLHCIRMRKAMQAEVSRLNAGVNRDNFPARRDSLVSRIPAATWYPQTELAYMKTASGWFFAAKGGHNNESHNHNDVGTCVLYVCGTPVLVDAGVGVYTRQTFSSERYSIWSMTSPWHNLPMPNGAAQAQGRRYASSDCACSPGKGLFTVDISRAYKAGESFCTKLRRSYTLAESSLAIEDEYVLSKRCAPDVERLLVKADVLLPGSSYEGRKVGGGEVLLLCDNSVVMRIAFPKSMKASFETRELTDRRMTWSWGSRLNLISFTSPARAPLKGKYKITVTRVR